METTKQQRDQWVMGWLNGGFNLESLHALCRDVEKAEVMENENKRITQIRAVVREPNQDPEQTLQRIRTILG